MLNDQKQKCLDAGMDGFVMRPCREEDIEEALKQWAPDCMVGR